MKSVGSYEAKTHLPRLLRRVARGEHITITKHGAPVATLTPPKAGSANPRSKRDGARPHSAPGDCAGEMRWLAEHRDQYAGQWVALDGDRLLAHGPEAQEVYAAARRSGVKLPLVVQVESADQLPFGGW